MDNVAKSGEQNCNQCEWMTVKNQDGDIFDMLGSYPAEPNTLQAMPWYFHELSKIEAIQLLLPEKAGTFLVGLAAEKYWLSVRTKHTNNSSNDLKELVKQYEIHINSKDESKRFFIYQQFQKESISNLVSSYKNCEQHLDELLVQPCPKSPSAVRIYQLDPRSKIIDMKKLKVNEEIHGEGNFGKVYQGDYDGYKVAIKKLSSKVKSEVFEKELTPLRELHHPNVVTCYGYCKDAKWIILEFVDNCLSKQLAKEVFTDFDLLVITTQIARGMAYIHSKNYIHRDLAARNVLVTNNKQAKVSDFGLTRKLGYSEGGYQASDTPTPFRSEALEVLKKTGQYTKSSDVWMFGILLFEIYNNGRHPFDNIQNKEEMINLLEKQHSPKIEKNKKMPQNIYDLQMKCINKMMPSCRPDFDKILKFYYDISAGNEPVSQKSLKRSASSTGEVSNQKQQKKL